MNLFKNKTPGKNQDLVTDKVAVALANQIISVQQRLSGSLNNWFNAFSTRQKKSILLSFGLLVSVLLITGAFTSFYTMPRLSQHNTSAHIGLPSDRPEPSHNKFQLTDSLTKNK